MNTEWTYWWKGVRGGMLNAIRHHAGNPVVYVEIGCWAAASAQDVYSEILTHPESMGFGIDPYLSTRGHDMDSIKELARKRMDGKRWHWIYEKSHDALRNWGRFIDILYIDGNHSGHNVVTDFALAWPWLKEGSTIVFDDYNRGGAGYGEGRKPHVREACDAIKIAWGGMLQWNQPTKRMKQISLNVVSKTRI